VLREKAFPASHHVGVCDNHPRTNPLPVIRQLIAVEDLGGIIGARFDAEEAVACIFRVPRREPAQLYAVEDPAQDAQMKVAEKVLIFEVSGTVQIKNEAVLGCVLTLLLDLPDGMIQERDHVIRVFLPVAIFGAEVDAIRVGGVVVQDQREDLHGELHFVEGSPGLNHTKVREGSDHLEVDGEDQRVQS